MPMFMESIPKDFSGILGQDHVIPRIISMISRYKASHEILPHILLTGPPGSGKTITAYAIAREIFGEDWRKSFREFNASDDRGINIVRNEIKPLTEVRGYRIIFLDESDELTGEAQDALRAIMQPSHKLTTTFILSANKHYKITDAIKSRCVEFHFRPLSMDSQKTILLNVLTQNNISLDAKSPDEVRQIQDGIDALIQGSNGDMRKAINTLEKIISENKSISVKEIVSQQSVELVPQILKSAITGEFDKSLQLVEDAFILGNYNVDQLINEISNTIKSTISDNETKAFLLIKLSDTEHRCRLGGNPIVHFSYFVSWAYVVPHLEHKTLTASKVV